MRDVIWASVFLALVGCGGEEPTVRGVAAAETTGEAAACPSDHPPEAEAAPTGPQPSAVLADGSRQFGGALTGIAPTELSAISASPTTFDGQTVQTAGTIERVCQRMGCWMELRAEGTEPIRVPMAGHSFFLPRDVAGHAATIEGRVQLTPLSPERRAHLESEGALATAGDLSIEATSVVVR
jgi:hypothetical protein